MEHAPSLLQDFAVIMVVAGVVLFLFRRLNQPMVLGYLVAGFIVGPNSPPFSFVHNIEVIREIADFGVVLLMFGLGLEFNLDRLKHVGLVAVAGAAVEIAIMIASGYFLGRAFGWTPLEAVSLGAALSISSTAIIVKVLQEMGRMDAESSRVMFDILVVEDFFAVALMTLLAGLGNSNQISFQEVGELTLRLALFTVVGLALGLHLFARFIDVVGRLRSREVLVVVTIGAAFAMALFADRLGLSIAAGAFLIGAITAEARHSQEIQHLSEPVRDLFGAMFFVSMGMLIDLRVVAQYAIPVALIVLAVIAGKMAACYLGVFFSGYSKKTAFQVGAGMSQVGEFSLVISKVGHDTGATRSFMEPLMAVVSGITALTAPYLIRNSDRLGTLIGQAVPAPIRRRSDELEFWSLKVRETLREDSIIARAARRGLALTGLNLAICVAALVAAGFLAGWVQSTNNHLLVERGTLSFVVGMTTLALCAPSLAALWRHLRRFLAAMVLRLAREEVSRSLFQRRLRLDVFPLTFSTAVILLLFLAATPLILRMAALARPVYLLPFALTALVLLWLAWDALSRFHGRVGAFILLRGNERGRQGGGGRGP